MSVEINCSNPSCKRPYKVPADKLGKSLKCRACGETFVAASLKTQGDDFMEPAWGDAKPAAPAATATPPAIGRFAIRGKLGAGAFGTVYRAYDPQLDRVVALKVPNPGVMTDPKRAERFLREAKAAANLHHPHIVPVFDAGKDGDSLYIASAFIGGKPLADSIPEGGTEFARAARLVRELAEALAYAHEQGIVHRDVKPANVMLDTLDRVHLMDFGLASRQEEAGRLTNDGAVMGTPAYMSPEQARGQKGDAQPATDQYAAGVVLYELLTGRTPFGGPVAAVIAAVLTTEPDPPRKVRPDVPKDLETICLKAMSKKPEDRYATCQALAADLRRWSEGEPVAARPLGFAERAVRWLKKEPKLAGAVAAVALMLLISVLVVSDAARRASAARGQAERDAAAARAAEKRAEDALNAAQAAKDAEERALGLSSGALGTAAQERKNALAERAKLEAIRATFPKCGLVIQVAHQEAAAGRIATARPILDIVRDEDRAWEWWYVANVCRSGVEQASQVINAHKREVTSASFSADGSRIVTSSYDGLARVWDAKTGAKVVTLQGLTGRVMCASFSPDGTHIVTGNGHNFTSSEPKVIEPPRVWDVMTGEEKLTLKGHTMVTSVSFSADGSRLVTGSVDSTAKVWDARTWTELFTLRGHTSVVRSVSFSADGSRIVTSSNDNSAKTWDAKTGAAVLTLKGTTTITSASFSPDGSRIVTALDRPQGAKVWDAKTGAELSSLVGHTDRVNAASFSPDGSRIVTGSNDNTARVWDAKTGVEMFALRAHTDWVNAASFSPDGSYILTSSRDGTVRIWDGMPAAKK